MEHKTAHIELTESNARYVLLALRELTEKLDRLAKSEDMDGDERFFHVNDLMETSRAQEKIEKAALAAFGGGVLVHNHDLL